MVKFFPERADISLMKPPPTEGERFLLDFLAKYLGKLDGEFEVFFQAHWDGSFPDVVVMRKNHGILIIEVKDWNLSSYKLEDANTWIVNSSDQKIKSPIAQVKYYKDLFYNTYSRTLAEKNLRDNKMYSLVQAAVFFYGATEEQVKNFFGILGADKHSLKYNYILLLTRDQLERDALKNFWELNFLLGGKESSFFTDDIYNELCRVLKPSEHSLTKIFFPETLDDKQKHLAKSAAGLSKEFKRQLRAPAGSGKTTVLAFRAVDAYRKTNAPVLILTYNITLCNYIRDCISQALNSLPNIQGRKGRVMRNFRINHFHGFIRSYRNENHQFDIVKYDENGREVDTYELTATPQKFQTIFVDETQDFERYWMETIVSLLTPTGELVFFGDWDQDIYEVRQKDAVPTGKAGVLRLNDGSYRLRSKIFNLAHEFQAKFLKNGDGELTAAKTRSKPATLFADDVGDSTTVQYHYFDSFDAEAIVDIFADALKEFAPPNDDICILSQVIRNVRPVEEILRDKGYKTITTFEKQSDWQAYHDTDDAWKIEDIRQAAKYNFRMESGKIKLATIQSYKGWGIHTEILIIGNDFNNAGDDKKFLNAEMVYTGITRAKKNLVIINIGDRQYDEFFRSATEDKIKLSKQKFDAARELYKRNDYNGAIKLLDAAIQLNPNYATAYYNRGLAYFKQQQYQRAIQDFDAAIQLNPNYAATFNNRGNAYQNLKQYQRAIQDYDAAIQLNPNLSQAYYNRGAAYKNLGEYHKAIADFQKYAELNPTDAATAYKKLGECYQMLATR